MEMLKNEPKVGIQTEVILLIKSDLTKYLNPKHVIKDHLYSLQLSQSRKLNKGIGVELVDGISLQLYLL